MTTIRQIIIDSMREAGVIAVDDTPEASQLDEALRRLQVLYSSLFGNELGEPLQPVNFGKAGLTNSYAKVLDASSEINSSYIPNNSRLILNVDAGGTLYLNPNPAGGARFGIVDNGANLATNNITVNGNGRHIELLDSVLLNTNSLNREWFYRDDLGSWIRVTDLDVDAQSPLPREFDDLLTTLLAFRLNPRYGAETSVEMIEVMKRIRRIFRARYRQSLEQAVETGLYRLTNNRIYWQHRIYWQPGNSVYSFNRG